MSGKELFEGMSYVSDRFVDEAEHKMLPTSTSVTWKKWFSVAACLCLVVAGVFAAWDYLPLHSANNQAAADTSGAYLVAGQQEGSGGNEHAEEMTPIFDLEEVPSIVLRINASSDDGFTGTVERWVDTKVIELGTQLQVIVTDDVCFETPDGEALLSKEAASSKPYFETGGLVLVQFTAYDAQSNTIEVNLIRFLEEKG